MGSSLCLQNTLTGVKEAFEPLEVGKVGMYTCGPTVYGYTHIGNFRAFLFYDLLSRHLRASGYDVTHVLNITDIEDKIIKQAAQAGLSAAATAEPFERAFREDLSLLRARPAEHYPTATAHIVEMTSMIDQLLASGHAYRSGGDVYFRIESFPAYGRLGRLDRAGLKAGARVAQDDYDKESATDFALWKGEDPMAVEVGAVWEPDFGRGRPGWHIECSAMSRKYLGDSFDIHCGGVDLIFPHHENEIAQSESATGKPMARYWLHNDHLVDAGGEKMARRKGNISTLRELLEEGHDPLAIRFFLMANAHYRSKLTMDQSSIRGAADGVDRLQAFSRRVDGLQPVPESEPGLLARIAAAARSYREALDDDLNLPRAVGYLFELVRHGNAAIDRNAVGSDAQRALRGMLDWADLTLDVLRPVDDEASPEIDSLVAERDRARSARDFAQADAIRAKLSAMGIQVEDSPSGARWRRVSR